MLARVVYTILILRHLLIKRCKLNAIINAIYKFLFFFHLFLLRLLLKNEIDVFEWMFPLWTCVWGQNSLSLQYEILQKLVTYIWDLKQRVLGDWIEKRLYITNYISFILRVTSFLLFSGPVQISRTGSSPSLDEFGRPLVLDRNDIKRISLRKVPFYDPWGGGSYKLS